MAYRRHLWTTTAAAALVLAGCASGGPEPIVLGGNPQAAALAEDASGATMPIGLVSYELAADLPALDSDAPAYRATGQGATQADARRLAATLGLPEPQATPEGGWSSGGLDGTGPSLWISASPLGDWWYGAGVAVACAEPAAPPEAPVTDEVRCAEPAPALRLPADEQAVALAGQLMADIGGWAGDSPQVTRDDYGVTVTFATQLGGVATPYSPTVRFGEDAVIESASGYFGAFESAGNYPRIGTDEAFVLLQSGRSAPWLPAADLPLASTAGAGDAGGGSAGGDAASGDAVTAESDDAQPVPGEPAPATDALVPPPAASEPAAPPEPEPSSGTEPGPGTQAQGPSQAPPRSQAQGPSQAPARSRAPGPSQCRRPIQIRARIRSRSQCRSRCRSRSWSGSAPLARACGRCTASTAPSGSCRRTSSAATTVPSTRSWRSRRT